MDRKKRSTSISRLREIIDLCSESGVSEITIPGIVSLKIGTPARQAMALSQEEFESLIGEPETEEAVKKREMDLLLHSAGV